MPLAPTPEVLSQRGSCRAQIHIRNLQAVILAGHDAWGRALRAQPVLISVSVGLSSPFTTSSSSDLVDRSTVHYGHLAKSILASLDCYSSPSSFVATATNPVTSTATTTAAATVGGGGGGDDDGDDATTTTTTTATTTTIQQPSFGRTDHESGTTLASVLVRVWSHLTGLSVDGRERNLPEDETAFLDVSRLRSLSLTLALPKASLLGTGVAITATAVFGPPAAAPGLVSAFAIQLAVRGVRVPTLVGVNANERLAKQIIIADVEIERFDVEGDVYTELEALIVKTMEESSYETLEALGTHLAGKIMSFCPSADQLTGRELGWQVKVSLEKPIAIPLADGPIVEVIVG